jgi:hypothetical protein
MWKKQCTTRRVTDDITRRMRFACWITKATNTRSEYVPLVAFLQQQWLRERSSMLRIRIRTLPVLLNTKASCSKESKKSLIQCYIS